MTAGFAKSPPAVRLRGVVGSGVERNSVVLLDERGQLLAQLMGGPSDVIVDGARVNVTGHFVTDLLTTAQQGRPFRVLAAVVDGAVGGTDPEGPVLK